MKTYHRKATVPRAAQEKTCCPNPCTNDSTSSVDFKVTGMDALNISIEMVKQPERHAPQELVKYKRRSVNPSAATSCSLFVGAGAGAAVTVAVSIDDLGPDTAAPKNRNGMMDDYDSDEAWVACRLGQEFE
ncbi:hypothetical protein EI94DRAFT_1701463 [Lactarius quietus]|nr:hypothetical protein EI94DRAFT_1701463 [Lactarius quietus]